MSIAKLSFIAASCLVAGSAAAQPAPGESSQSVLPAVLPTIAGTTFDARVDYSNFGGNDFGDVTLLALDLHGQHITPSGLGGYLALPLAYASGGDESESYLGNLELGGLYVIRGANVDAYARGGLAVETASGEGFEVPITHLISRPADALTTGLGMSWLRLGGGVRLTSGSLVIGGSGGFDVGLDSEADANTLHLTGTIGVAQPGFGFAVGITTVQSLEDSGGDDNFFGFQAVGDAAIGGRSRFYAALGLNFEDDTAFSLGAGVRLNM